MKKKKKNERQYGNANFYSYIKFDSYTILQHYIIGLYSERNLAWLGFFARYLNPAQQCPNNSRSTDALVLVPKLPSENCR